MNNEPAIREKSKMTPLQIRWDRLLFSVRRSVRYHTRRRCFFERLGFTTSFVSVCSGGGTGITALVQGHHIITAILGFITAASSSSDLIIGYAAKARLYHDLSRKFIELEKAMVAIGNDPTEEQFMKATQERLSIEADEPPKLCVLDLVCHNEVVRALGRDEGSIRRIPKWKRLLCHLHDWDSSDCESLFVIKNREEDKPKPVPSPPVTYQT